MGNKEYFDLPKIVYTSKMGDYQEWRAQLYAMKRSKTKRWLYMLDRKCTEIEEYIVQLYRGELETEYCLTFVNGQHSNLYLRNN